LISVKILIPLKSLITLHKTVSLMIGYNL
jgi:hypothetical protein